MEFTTPTLTTAVKGSFNTIGSNPAELDEVTATIHEVSPLCSAFTQAGSLCTNRATNVNSFGYLVCNQHKEAQFKLDDGDHQATLNNSLALLLANQSSRPTSEYEQATLF